MHSISFYENLPSSFLPFFLNSFSFSADLSSFFLAICIFISYIYIYISFSRCYNFKFIFSKYFFDISNISLTFFHSLIPSIPRWTHLQRMIFSSSNHLVSSVQRGAGGIQKGVGGKGNNNVLSYHFQVVIWN